MGDFNYWRRSFSVDNLAVRVNKGQPLNITRSSGDSFWYPWVFHGKDTLFVTLNYLVEENTLKPNVEWDNNCPADTGNAVEIKAQCTQPAETRTREVNLDNVFMCNILSGNLSDKIIPSNAKWQFA